ncbi:MAG TPA: hypothetical protein VHN14_17830 [Kofleriaceae bacterium]|jgi:hypothetical protein|nr:hypothetical protein [Kofleriaceae bacterium]
MSTTNSNETRTLDVPQHASVPDGQSALPLDLPDYPPPTSGGSGDSGGAQAK